uniref:Uncharacterized protein n=1 Tax=Triticum urartu TaxID=4572 RepID=A0A8R7JXR1_TRIUA
MSFFIFIVFSKFQLCICVALTGDTITTRIIVGSTGIFGKWQKLWL